MNLPDIITDKTRYDVHKRDLISIMKADMPAFNEYDGPLPVKKLFQYIILMYDPESPMRREIGHYMQRKSGCAEVVGLPKEGDKWSPAMEDVLIGKNEEVNKLIAAYLSNLSIPEYTELIVLLEIQRIKTMEAFSGDVTDNTHKTMGAVTESISRITKQLFGSGELDEIKAARRALYEQTNIDKPPIPEDVVAKLNEGILTAEFNPYGKDYMVEDAHFLDDEQPQG